MTNAPIDQTKKAEQLPEESPSDISKPVGDAIPAPVEPGLDQPLPEKSPTQSNKDKPADDEASEDPIDKSDTPVGETETPPGVPPPGPSDFA